MMRSPAQDVRAARELSRVQLELTLERFEHGAAARVPQPGRDVGALQFHLPQRAIEQLRRTLRCQLRNFGREDVAQHAALLLEAQGVAMRGLHQRLGSDPSGTDAAP